ncbi:hypothetical protein BASA50_002262 [Batrachochytrium salamandrivorans]|uniref:FAD-binding FR-type domain-containing protein n=1 Tax=Batrachochytrium salamandrivorans TaxID=1357716 RepID=A0ABQ8FLU7_9FUNG|nr:hypothetical protein BASA61_006648 [Batrachochytrium salamandrivorans]KAH6600517.1 hypothetical protein BASA50_002262 [Batrachochytrium salamandrivorans]
MVSPNTQYGLRYATAAACLIAFAYTLVLPSLARMKYVSFSMTSYVVSHTDAYFLAFGVAPFGVVSFLMYMMSGTHDHSVSLALSPESSNNGSAPSRLWAPRWSFLSKYSRLFSTWSQGDVIISSILIVTHVIWLVLPVILRVVLIQTTSKVTLKFILSQLSNSAGMVGMWDAGLAIIFAVRENLATKAVLGNDAGQFHRGIRYHIALGYSSFTFITLHSIYYLGLFIYTNVLYMRLIPAVSKDGYMFLMGVISWAALIFMIISSIFKSRRSNYRIFYWTHQLYVVFLLFAFAHAYITSYPMLGPLAYFIYDRILPRLKVKRHTVAVLTRVSTDITRVDIPITSAFSSSSTYAPGDWINILVPSISSMNWHPFSIASCHASSTDVMTLFVRNRGSWTRQLYDAASDQGTTLPVKVDGVFGSRSTEYLRHKHLVLIGAGTGVAALFPYLLNYARLAQGRITLVWSARNISDVCVYREVLDLLADPHGLGQRVTLHMHITRATPPTSMHQLDIDRTDSHKSDGSTSKRTNDESTSNRTSDESTIKGSIFETGAVAVMSKKKGQQLPHQQIQFGMFASALALVIVGTWMAGYAFGRLYLPGYDESRCMQKETYLLAGVSHFMCWHYYKWAPTVFGCLFSAVCGRLFVLAASAFRIRISGVSEPTSSEVDIAKISANASPFPVEDFSESFQAVAARPQLETILSGVFNSAKDRAESVAVLAAGPEGMMRQAETVTMQAKHAFYRESFKV